jgi:4'-phosphopantetheinyl transferase
VTDRERVVRWLAVAREEVPAGDEWLGPDERDKQATLRFSKRRDDWRLKRWAAKQALQASTGLGALERLQVLNTAAGIPVPHDGSSALPFALSLADREGTALCTLGPAGARLGCDIELVEPRSAAFVGDWFTPEEQAAVAAAGTRAAADLVANLIWSAKEAALKALGIGLRRPTRAVTVTATMERPAATPTEWASLTVVVAEGALAGWWRRYRGFVLAVVTDALGPPEPL